MIKATVFSAMKLLVLLSAAALIAQAAVTINPVTALPPGKPCQDRTINLGERDKWILRLTPVAASQACNYQFIIPSNSYAVVNFTGFGAGSGDQMQIKDTLEDIVVSNGEELFMNYGAWPVNFTVMVKTSSFTKMQVALNVTVVASRPTANVKQINVAMNQPSAVQYFENWPVGMTYRFKGLSGAVAMYPVGFTGDISKDAEFRNVFVYNNGHLVGTLQTFLTFSYNATFGDLMLYAPMRPMTRGAVMVTDFTNVKSLTTYQLTYVPYSYPMMTNSYNIYGRGETESALTVVGDMDGSNPIDITSYKNLFGGTGTFSVAVGAPTANHATAMDLDQSSLPKHLTGNIWTIYLSREAGSVTIHTVSSRDN